MFERGQAALETALVMPLMIFFTLGIIQLAMVQQARLMTEYAAYQAARAGIVWNANNERMHDAAVFALLPTMGGQGQGQDWSRVAQTYKHHTDLDAAMQALPWGNITVNGQSLSGQVRVDLLNPNKASGTGLWNNVNGNGWEELDFDAVSTFPEGPGLDPNLVHFFNLQMPDPAQRQYRNDTILEIRLRYFYEMRVPFANQIIFLAWYAVNADVALYGAIDRSTTRQQNMLGKSGDASGVRGRGKGILDSDGKGYVPVDPVEMAVLWDVSTGAMRLLGAERRYFLPLYATHSMRMQSNVYRKWLVH